MNRKWGKPILALGILFLIVALLLFIFVDTIAIAIFFGLSIILNVTGLTLLTMPNNNNATNTRQRRQG